MTWFTLFEHWLLITIGYFLRIFYVWFNNRPPKLITRNIYIHKYDDIQEFHKDKFKKLINDQLKQNIKEGKSLPVCIDYRRIFSKYSLEDLKCYIKDTLQFDNFELDQEGCVCRLILKE